jgi:hypothetical protein
VTVSSLARNLRAMGVGGIVDPREILPLPYWNKQGAIPIMRKLLKTGLIIVALAISGYSICAAQSKTTDFSGKWTLDKSRTSDLPSTLESYTMTVSHDVQQLAYETDLQGEVGMRGRRGGGQREVEGAPRADGRGQGRGGAGGNTGTGGLSMSKEAVIGMALRMSPAKAAYTFDGREILQKIEGDDRRRQPGGSIGFKANWKKGGKALELQSTRKFETPEGERTITSNDLWELSEDGSTLTVKRSVDLPTGMEEVKFVFAK